MEHICWLRVTDYMRGWTRMVLGTRYRVHELPVIQVKGLDGASEVLAMSVSEELPGIGVPGNAMCDTWHAALEAGLEVDAWGMEREFGITREVMDQYLPVLCPDVAVDEDYITHPWTSDTCFGREQAIALQRLLRDAFWSAVDNYASDYKRAHSDAKYAQIDMLESFCKEYKSDDTHIDAMRREWQRRQKREG